MSNKMRSTPQIQDASPKPTQAKGRPYQESLDTLTPLAPRLRGFTVFVR